MQLGAVRTIFIVDSRGKTRAVIDMLPIIFLAIARVRSRDADAVVRWWLFASCIHYRRDRLRTQPRRGYRRPPARASRGSEVHRGGSVVVGRVQETRRQAA